MSGTNEPTLDRSHGLAVTPGDLQEGTEIGEYRIVKKIGEGGMGAVYSAIQPVIGKRVAIKVIAQHIASNPDVVRRFVDEARAVNKIGHPNIVDIFSFGWLPDKRHYFAMEFLDGSSLSDRFRDRPLGAAEARRILRQICEALEAAHRQGIVHRDLKPDNIWVAVPQHGESFAKLLDFGIAKLLGNDDAKSKTQTGTMMGTPAYMAPEQCRGEGIDSRTDIYALGVILYEMFARRLPFDGGFAELITHHLMTVPVPPSRYVQLPPALDALIMACLEKDQAKRPQTAAELGRLLESALPTETVAPAGFTSARTEIKAPPMPDTLSPTYKSSIQLTQAPAKDRRPLFIAGGLGAVALIAVVVVAAGGKKAAPPTPPPAAAPAPPPVAVPTPPRDGRVHVVVDGDGADGARILLDGAVVTSGAREARIPNVIAGKPHQLRVELAGRPPVERTFEVTAGGDVELAVALGKAPAPEAKPPRTGHRREKESSAAPTSPLPGAEKHHRDSLVGDDIFDASKK
jgi:serine/threonine protein kinase